MKKLSFLALAAVGLLFGACASNDTVEEKTVEELLQGRDGSYISVAINLPTSAATGTRADSWSETDGDTPILDDGLTKEYDVQNVLLLIFSGTSEADAKLAQVENLTPDFKKVTDTPEQITTNSKYGVLLKTTGTYLGALAVINGKGIIERVDDKKINLLGTEKEGITLATLQDEVAAANEDGSTKFVYKVEDNTYFFMTNAVLSDTRGGAVEPKGAKVSVLAPVDLTVKYDSKEDAEKGTDASVDIYVERGVAKVTVEAASTGFLSISGWKKDGSTFAGTGQFLGWTLDNTNKKSYVVRRVDMPESDNFAWNLINEKSAADEYRFIGTSSVDKYYTTDEKVNYFRTYWAKDPNYNKDIAKADLKNEFYNPGKKTLSTVYGKKNPQYCYENTFDVKHQTYYNTTRAIVGVKVNNGDFYTVGNNQTTLYTEDGMKGLVKAQLLSIDAFTTWYDTNGKGTLEADNISIGFSSSDAGEVTVKSITIAGANTKTGSGVSVSDAIITSLNNNIQDIKYYKDGKS